MRLQLEKTSAISSLVGSLKIVGMDTVMMGVLDRAAAEFPPGSPKLLQPGDWHAADPSKVCVPWSIESVPDDDLAEMLHPGSLADSPRLVVLPFSCQARELERRLRAIFVGDPLQFSEYPELMSMLSSNSLMGSRRWRNWLARCKVRSVVEDGNSMLAATLVRNHRTPLNFISRIGVDSGDPMTWVCQKPHLLTSQLIRMGVSELRRFLIDYICFLESWYGQEEKYLHLVQGGCASALTTLGCLYLEGMTSRTRLHSLRILSALRGLMGEPVDMKAHVADISLHLQWAGLVEFVEHFSGNQHWLVVGFQGMDWHDLERVSVAGDEAVRKYIKSFLKALQPGTPVVPVASNPSRLIRHLRDDCVETMRSHTVINRTSQISELAKWWSWQLGQGLTFVLLSLLSSVPALRHTKALSELKHLDFEDNYGENTTGSLLVAISNIYRLVGTKSTPDWLLNLLDVTDPPPRQYDIVFNEFTDCIIEFESHLEKLVPGPIKQALSVSFLSVFCWAWRSAYRYVDVATLLVRNEKVNKCVLETGMHPSVLVWPLFMSLCSRRQITVDHEMDHALKLVLDTCDQAGPSASVEYLKSDTFLHPFMDDMPALTLLRRSMSLLPLGGDMEKTYTEQTRRAFHSVNAAGLLPDILNFDARKRLMKRLALHEGLSMGILHRRNLGVLTTAVLYTHQRKKVEFETASAEYLAAAFLELLPFYSHCEGVVAAQTSFDVAQTAPEEPPEESSPSDIPVVAPTHSTRHARQPTADPTAARDGCSTSLYSWVLPAGKATCANRLV
ncbi:MAG: hypothetical protein KVP17_003524 [Porospora cf. gigantea B]|uniref:uncharacterized protein n=1 Tax=Porospora cf. gigantea B TaxID=2853592 RepID=UPI003571F0F5|nr:MAG: hypothetical protein KVP17_003524 [Porospora cf. gigantea B]